MEPPFKKIKKEEQFDLKNSIIEQRNNMNQMVHDFKSTMKQNKNSKKTNPKPSGSKIENSPLNTIEKQIQLYTSKTDFQKALNNWQFYYDLVLVDHLLTGKFGSLVFSVKFSEDDENIIETNCPQCTKLLWCEHIGSLLFSFSRSKETVVNYEEIKEKMKITGKGVLMRCFLNISKRKPELLHEIENELKKIQENEEPEETQMTQEETDQMEEELEFLPIVENSVNIVMLISLNESLFK
jgi:hypothetical protein